MTQFPDRIPIRTLADVEAIERALPWDKRCAHLTTFDLVRDIARRDPAHPAIVFLAEGVTEAGVETVSYGDLSSRVTAAANAFEALGLVPGDTVSYVLPNLPEVHVINIGAQAAGISNPINPLMSAAQIAEIVCVAEAKVLCAYSDDDDAWQKAEQVKALAPCLHYLVAVGDRRRDGALHLGELLAAQPGDALRRRSERGPQDIAACFHTGGTTGKPKLARQRHVNQLFEAWAFAYLLDLQPSDRFCVGLPLFHVHAVIPNSLGVFFAGATQVLLSPAGYRNPRVIDNLWNIIKSFRATAFSAVPTIYSALMARGIDAEAAASLRYCICGSAPLSPEQASRFRELTGVTILEGYGLTEGTCVSSLAPPNGERRVGSIGLRLPYQEMKAVRFASDGAMVDCADGEIGHLVVRGPNVFAGYCYPADNVGVLLADGWLDTGDLGRRDSEGYFWLTGRTKDIIKRSGHSIDPQIVEECLFQHPAVALAAAIGRPDAYAGELPVCYVTLKPGATASSEELRDFARARIADRAAAPAEVVICETMPLTAVGKIYKPQLREHANRAAALLALPAIDGIAVDNRSSSEGSWLDITVRSPADAAAVEASLSGLMLRYQITIDQREDRP
ncbi:acyl-CoA synthetase [Bradyrhizobium sp. 14AA]